MENVRILTVEEKQIQELKKRLEEIDRQIIETEKHLPAHSVKPPIMREIFELEVLVKPALVTSDGMPWDCLGERA